MHVILSYATGRRTEGILLAASPNRLRIAVRRQSDTVELRQVEGDWLSDDGEPVEIESWISDGASRASDFFLQFVQVTRTACN